MAVETVQLVSKVGCFDVDDLILNTIGVALGYICYSICHKIISCFRKGRGQKERDKEKERE